MDYSLDGDTIPLAIRIFKQPATDKEETRQTEQEKNIIPPHPHISQAKTTNMRIDNENHGKSSHRINIFYPLFGHYDCKDTELFTITWIIQRNNLDYCLLIRIFAV